MQVALATEQLVAAHWDSVWYLFRWFSVVSLVGAVAVSIWFILLWSWIFLDEWICTVRRKAKRRQDARYAGVSAGRPAPSCQPIRPKILKPEIKPQLWFKVISPFAIYK
ncbi:hypothetical protein GQ44DRAFT_817153 [Phaeosphaeriaceae sp. PMI808]|nr:hypothetical protein GQ44DRAFT_817153 [Phaeosphaeriaceae sp. PMI808]